MFGKLTHREGLLSDADHYAEAARAQRKRAERQVTVAHRAECIARAVVFEGKARRCRQEAEKPAKRQKRTTPDDWPEIKF